MRGKVFLFAFCPNLRGRPCISSCNLACQRAAPIVKTVSNDKFISGCPHWRDIVDKSKHENKKQKKAIFSIYLSQVGSLLSDACPSVLWLDWRWHSTDRFDLQSFRWFLSDPGLPGVRSMVPMSLMFGWLNWCVSGWWRYQLNTSW